MIHTNTRTPLHPLTLALSHTITHVMIGFQLAMFAFVRAKWLIYLTTLVAALGSMCYPAISSLVSHSVTAEQQGAVQVC